MCFKSRALFSWLAAALMAVGSCPAVVQAIPSSPTETSHTLVIGTRGPSTSTATRGLTFAGLPQRPALSITDRETSQFAFTYQHKGSPVGWNPGTRLTWSWVDGSATDRAMVAGILRTVGQLTGLRFVQAKSGGQLKLRYGTPSGIRVGETMFATSYLSQHDCDVATLAIVTFTKSSKTWSRTWRLNLYLHELGHAVGLDHVHSTRQAMYPSLDGVSAYGAGDRAGLARLGHLRKCVD